MEDLNIQGLTGVISAGANLIYIQTERESRTEGIIRQAALRLQGIGTPFIWTCTEGFISDGNPVADTTDPLKALDYALIQSHPGLFLF